MPIYEYLCDSCGRQFEKNQSMQDPPLEICPECKGKMKRIISGGSGFISQERRFRISFSASLREDGNLLRQQNAL